MGEVYRARDTRLAREVALKRLSNVALDDEVARRRILREGRAAAALSHPGIAAIFDILDTPDGLFIVMEYVPGQGLGSERPLPVGTALDFAAQIAHALAHAHANGIVHRDLKPANVRLTPTGQVKILDFGIAKSIGPALDPADSGDDLATAAGQIVGSPGYMAPEQILGRPTDPRTDVYALGVILFELIAGRRPFPATNVFDAAMAAVNGPAPRLIDFAPQVPRTISDMVERAMARAPEDRFASAAAFASAIEQAQHSLGDTETHLLTAAVPVRRGRAPLIAAVTLVLIAAGALYVWTRVQSMPDRQPSPVVGVLPFRNAAGKPEDAALAAGLTDAVVKRLGAVRALQILPQDEVRDALKASNGSAGVARALGASFVVDGEVSRSGDALHVSVQLIADDGLARRVGRYSGNISHQFDLHKTVADALAAAFSSRGVIQGNSQAEPAPPTSDPDAFADYSQARVFLDRPDVPGSLDHAISLLEGAIKRDPRFALAYAALGEAYWAQWRETKDAQWTTRAQAANLEALRIDPHQPEVRMALAVMYEGLGHVDKASEELKQVIAVQPRNDNAHFVLAKIAADKGQWDAAVAESRAAIALRPAYWRNHAQLGDTLLRAGRLEEAAAAFARVVELQPDSVRGYQRLGRVLQALGRNDEALKNYEQAVRIGPSYGAYANMGTLYYWRGDNARAVDAYEKASALAPNEPDIYANLGDALMKMGQKRRALQYYQRAVDEVQKALVVKENDALNVASLALYRAKLGERAAAAQAIDRASRLSPEDAEVLYIVALVRALANDTTGACTAVGKALAAGKSAEEIRRADELKTLKGCAAYDGLLQPVR